ncbi:iron chelate uptake ABC transporter family permease subunit [Micromonospora sp. M12]
MTALATRPNPARNRSGTRTGRRAAVTVGAALVLLLTVLASFALGSRQLGVDQVWHALVAPDGGDASTIVRELRMPVPRSASPSGSRSPWPECCSRRSPATPRRAAHPRHQRGRVVRVVLAISVFGVGTLAGYVWFGIAGALIAGLLVFAIATRAREGASPVTLALVGAALDASLASGVYALLSIDARTFEEYRFWVVGGLAGRDLSVTAQVAPSSSPGWCWPPWWPAVWTRWPSVTTWPVVSATGSAWSASAVAWPPCC